MAMSGGDDEAGFCRRKLELRIWLPLACYGQPVLQHVPRIAQDFSKNQSHTKVRMGIDDRRGRFEDLCFGENFQAYGCSVDQRIEGIHIASGGAEVANARGEARVRVFRQHFRRGNERESWRPSPLLVHDNPLGKWDTFYPEFVFHGKPSFLNRLRSSFS